MFDEEKYVQIVNDYFDHNIREYLADHPDRFVIGADDDFILFAEVYRYDKAEARTAYYPGCAAEIYAQITMMTHAGELIPLSRSVQEYLNDRYNETILEKYEKILQEV